MYTFHGSDGSEPDVALIQGADGNFYGITYSGGLAVDGTVYTITADGTLTTLHHFTGSDGRFPDGALIEGADGSFYGTARTGGDGGAGVVYRLQVPPRTATPSVLRHIPRGPS